MVGVENHVTPNLHSLAVSLLPPTGHSINLIASSCCTTLARDKWASRALHASVSVSVRARVVILGERWGRAPSLHHMVKVRLVPN